MMVPHKLAILLTKLQEAGCGPIRTEGEEYRCRCPAHTDRGPSCYFRLVEDKILIRCNADCSTQAICDRLDHDVADLFYSADEPRVDWTLAASSCHNSAPASADMVEPGMTASAADSCLRQHVYQDLLDKLELNAKHFQDLQGRGLVPCEITARGYKTVDADRIRKAVDALLNQYGRDQLLTVPGFHDKEGRVLFRTSKGFLIPVRSTDGTILALKVRHDADANGPKYTWISSREVSCGSPVHVPLAVSTPAGVVRLTEGELKADVATVLSGMPTISVSGVSNWATAVPVLRDMAASKVHLAFDQDGKPGTLATMEKALYGLTSAGFDVVLEWWDGKRAKGIDDLLHAEHQPEVLSGLNAAIRVRQGLSPASTEESESEEAAPEPFPLEVFPPLLAAYCREMAAATATPPDFAAQALLVTAAAAIGNSRALCLKAGVWYEAPRIYAVNVGDPASGKTPAMDGVVKPYQAIQLRLLKEYKDAKAQYDRAVAQHDQVLKENRVLPADERRPVPIVPEEPNKPERLLAMDATVESLAPLLEQNPRGLLMPQDEGVAWVRGMGQYKGGRGNDRQFWLASWSGKSHIVDRKSSGVIPVSIPRPFLNVICGLPPDMLNELADHQGRSDGFLHRLLYVYPRVTVGTEWTEQTVTDESQKAWVKTLTHLRLLAMAELEDGILGYRAVQFSAAAKERWIEWWDAHAAEIRGTDLPVALIGPWGKLKAYAARLALVLHFLWLVQTEAEDGELDLASVERAVRLIDYYKSHLRLVYTRLRQTPEDNHVFEVLDWIRKRGGQCRPRDLVHAKKVTPTDKAKKMLRELEERGYGRLDWREAPNGRKVTWFILDPR